MKEEIKQEQEQEPENIDYIEAIEKLKENSVPKEDYEKLREENKRLLDNFINGNVEKEQQEKKEIDVKALEKRLSERDPRMTTLEGMKLILDLREADMSAGKRDPFISANNHAPTKEDFEKAEQRAQIYKECIDYAEGDPNLFAQELSRRTIDNFKPIRRK